MTPLHELGLVKPTYRAIEACAVLSVGRTKLWQLVKSGQIRSRKCGSRQVFLATDIAAFLSSLPYGGAQR